MHNPIPRAMVGTGQVIPQALLTLPNLFWALQSRTKLNVFWQAPPLTKQVLS